ncbi:MAG: O-antigen ligase family protein [Elusimicrobiaceae bacterium]|nr:O-antigen ligase family protein [Elusimicrobiaceae bacterium]
MDSFAKSILAVLLFFVPFAFAGAEPWAFSVLQVGLVLCWGVLLFTRRTWFVSPLFIPVGFTLGYLVVLTLLQTCFAKTLLDPAAFYPISLMPLYGWEHASLFVTYGGVVALVAQLYTSQQKEQRLLTWALVSVLCVALCAASLPKGEYIFLLTGLRGGIGPFLNRNHAAVFFAMGALIGLGLFFTRQLRAVTYVSCHKRNVFYIEQALLFAAFIALCTAVVMTRSRGGMMSLLVGIFCYALLCVWAVPHRLQKRLKGIFITLVAGVLVSGWIFTHVKEINSFALRSTGASTQTRTMLYRSAGQMLNKYPVWGIGVGAMPVAITSYVERPVASYIERLHNDWLEILLGVGYVGALPLLMGLLWFVWQALKRLKRLETRKQFLFASLLSVLAAMAVGSGVDFHFFIPANALLFFVVLGLCCAPTYAKGGDVSLFPCRRVLWLLVLCIALYIPARKTFAWCNVVAGRKLETTAKLTHYKRALSYYPSPRHAVRLGNAYMNASLHAGAEEEKTHLRRQALEVAVWHLRRWPREKELSALYYRARNLDD